MKRLQFPRDVLIDPRASYDDARAAVPPSELRFALEGAPRPIPGGFELRGVLTNPTDRDIRIVVHPVNGVSPFYAAIRTGPEIDFWRDDDPGRPNIPPMPPPAPPWPMAVVVPAHAELELTSSLPLERYKYRGAPTAIADWSFLFWNDPKPHGTVELKLPPR